VLLQVLDDGRLTDGQGRTVDFRNTIIVLTSNLGSQAIAELPESADIEAARPAVMRAVRERFRPEFLNRLDEIVLFRRLRARDMASIVRSSSAACAACWRTGRSWWSSTPRRSSGWRRRATTRPMAPAR
jgi:ATP-dependent Clp protease ATP-binding subunit ClpA